MFFQEFWEDLALNVTREKQKHTRTRHAFPRALLQLFQSGKKRAKFGDGAPCNFCWVSWMMEICGILWLSAIILIHTILSKLMVANLGTKIAFLIFRGTNVTFFSVALVLSLYQHSGNMNMFLTLPCESQPPIVATASIWNWLVQYTYMKIRKNPITRKTLPKVDRRNRSRYCPKHAAQIRRTPWKSSHFFLFWEGSLDADGFFSTCSIWVMQVVVNFGGSQAAFWWWFQQIFYSPYVCGDDPIW